MENNYTTGNSIVKGPYAALLMGRNLKNKVTMIMDVVMKHS